MQGWQIPLTAYASTPGQKDWRGFGNLINQDRLSQMNPFQYGVGMFAAGQENFGGQIGGAMSQIGAVNAMNQQAAQQAAMMQFQADQANAERKARDEKFSMLFKALIGDPGKQVTLGRDKGSGQVMTGMQYSPIMQALSNAIGGNRQQIPLYAYTSVGNQMLMPQSRSPLTSMIFG